jgi:hypothetical protein
MTFVQEKTPLEFPEFLENPLFLSENLPGQWDTQSLIKILEEAPENTCACCVCRVCLPCGAFYLAG